LRLVAVIHPVAVIHCGLVLPRRPKSAAEHAGDLIMPRMDLSRSLLAVILALALAAGCSTAGPMDQASPSASIDSTPSVSADPGADPGTDIDQDGLAAVPEVAARLAPSVVTVLTPTGSGSGVVFRADGLIITNEHVVRGATDVQIAFADGQRVAARVRATDAVTDLALVEAARSDLPAARFAAELPVVGSLAVVIGAPLGFQNSVTAGVISGLHREIPGSAVASQALVDLLQTDAAISPGNSGGALANAEAEVVGITVAYIPPQGGAVSLGFAIPAATVQDIAEQLERSGRAEHAFVGLQPAPITPQIAQQLGLDSTEGSIIAGVVPGGPAEQAGLRAGDVITAVDEDPIASPEELLAALREYRPGDTVPMTIRSPGGDMRQVQVTVTDRPAVSSR
jgi:S1-C subfamily serine protease